MYSILIKISNSFDLTYAMSIDELKETPKTSVRIKRLTNDKITHFEI